MGTKRWTVERKDEIETMFIDMVADMGWAFQADYEDIVQDIYETVCTEEEAHEWNSDYNWLEHSLPKAFEKWVKQTNDAFNQGSERVAMVKYKLGNPMLVIGSCVSNLEHALIGMGVDLNKEMVSEEFGVTMARTFADLNSMLKRVSEIVSEEY